MIAQVFHQRLAFAAVGMYSDINRCVMIEAQTIVRGTLAEGAHCQRLAELRAKESIYLAEIA